MFVVVIVVVVVDDGFFPFLEELYWSVWLSSEAEETIIIIIGFRIFGAAVESMSYIFIAF